MTICELRNVTKSYGEGATRVDAIKNVSLAIEPGEFTVFSGPSGSGKTTLLNQVGCLDRPTDGELLIEGKPTSALNAHALSQLRAHKIGFIFQSFNLVPVLTALENVELALQLAGQTSGVREQALAMFPKVSLTGLEGRRPNQLSGGQQQRVAIARALVKVPVMVIADEPTANLDSDNGEQILALMEQLNADLGTTFLISTHDPRVMAHARRRIVMKDGQIVSDEAGARQAAAPEARQSP
ncbi:MAG: ABC transporter ATP-binding protein [Myxococcales bacterium]|nr:ABC transporter ATP-binding protein [Myxococcales bacterium]MDD9966174.1 ABC transporter ATP-binding protein [Myxococcales bacterium]